MYLNIKRTLSNFTRKVNIILFLSKVSGIYIKSTFLVILIIAIGKYYEVFGDTILLKQRNPIFWFLTNKQVFSFVGSLELGVCSYIFMSRNNVKALWSIMWLELLFCSYRFALFLVGYDGYCGCIGSWQFLFFLRNETSTLLASVILFYLIFGSSCLLALSYVISPAHNH